MVVSAGHTIYLEELGLKHVTVIRSRLEDLAGKTLVDAIVHRVDIHTFDTGPAESIGLNDIARVRLRTSQPLVVDPYGANRATGSFTVTGPTDAEPEIKVVMQGVEALNFYKADQIIALGGGSVIDAAKIMKLKYESPQADLEELAAPFLDLRKRVVQYPTEKSNRAQLIAISTTSGTGSEVTPFAVLMDKERGRKVTLADYSLSPDVAIVDPQFVMSMPKGVTADTGIDCLTHALEAGVSTYASPYTDSNAMQAIRMAFKYLPIAYDNPGDEEARLLSGAGEGRQRQDEDRRRPRGAPAVLESAEAAADSVVEQPDE